jgi:signal transduction histidine kinase
MIALASFPIASGATLPRPDAATRAPAASFGEFFSLPLEEARTGVPFTIRCTLLAMDKEWGQFYIFDGTDTQYVDPKGFKTTPDVKPGDSIDLIGTTTVTDGRPAMTNLSVKVLGKAIPPKPLLLSFPQISTHLGAWVELHGRVKLAETTSGRLRLILQEGDRFATAYILGVPRRSEYKYLMDRMVRLRGVNVSRGDAASFDSAVIMVPALNAVSPEGPESGGFNSPVLAIRDLLNRPLGSWTNNRVHINGVASDYIPGKRLLIKDPTGAIHARTVQSFPINSEQRVDAWGFIKIAREGPVLDFAYIEPVRLGAAAPQENNTIHKDRPALTLTNLADVLQLKRNEAARGYSVNFRGIVTFADADWKNGFVQDRGYGIYFRLNQSEIHAGDYVEVSGQTSAGGFATDLETATLRFLSHTNFPAPVKTTLQELASGTFDAQWVELDGVVRRLDQQWGHAYLTIVTPHGRFKVLIPGLDDAHPPTHLVNAIVRVQGACTSDLNAQHQLVGIILQTPDLNHVQVLESAPADPFSIDSTPIAEVATFNPEHIAGRQVKISGAVTLSVPQTAIVVQDSSGGIRVRTTQAAPVRVGDQVEVLGYPTIGDFGPELEEGSYRVVGRAPAVPAPRTTAEQILTQGAHNQQLVTLSARLMQAVPKSASPEFILQDGSIIFSAQTRGIAQTSDFSWIRPGSMLSLTGVCAIQGGEDHKSKGFRLFVRTPDDVRVIKSPPWWNDSRVIWAASAILLLAIISAIWSVALARKNRLLRRAQGELKKANDELELRVADRTRNLMQEIAERKQAEAELEKVYKQLLTVSRQAGMAEVATSVLHNVGNVLNSVNVSCTLLSDRAKKSKVGTLARIAGVLQGESHDLPNFFATDPRGKQLPSLLNQLADHMASEQKVNLQELESLTRNVDHIKDIVGMQQSYAKVSGVRESLCVTDLIEDALRMNASSLERHNIRINKDYSCKPEVTLEKHKALQILVNLVRNAQQSCEESATAEKWITCRVTNGDSFVRIAVADNGVGIPQENLTRIFSHGFTTRKNGHGFGLHSGALAARELGGALKVQSAGPGQGATFTLELPLGSLHHDEPHTATS